jgi:hypothetical protein
MIWEKLSSMTAETGFDAEMAIMSSCIAEPLQDRNAAARKCALARIARLLSYKPYLNDQSRKAFHDRYLPEMVVAMGHHWHNSYVFKSPLEELGAVNFSRSRGCKQMKLLLLYSPLLLLSLQDAGQEILLALQYDRVDGVDLRCTTTAPLLVYFVGKAAPASYGDVWEHRTLSRELVYVSLARKREKCTVE